jgi:hypothetical protein
MPAILLTLFSFSTNIAALSYIQHLVFVFGGYVHFCCLPCLKCIVKQVIARS